MRHGALFFSTPLIVLLLSAMTAAAGSPVPIEGKLVFSTWDLTDSASFVMEGTSDNVTPLNLSGCLWPDASPREDRYAVTVNLIPDTVGVLSAETGTVALDGSDLINISQLAGLGGINCCPIWSPDANQVAFNHCDPVVGMLPCEVGFSVMANVLDADKSIARRV